MEVFLDTRTQELIIERAKRIKVDKFGAKFVTLTGKTLISSGKIREPTLIFIP